MRAVSPTTIKDIYSITSVVILLTSNSWTPRGRFVALENRLSPIHLCNHISLKRFILFLPLRFFFFFLSLPTLQMLAVLLHVMCLPFYVVGSLAFGSEISCDDLSEQLVTKNVLGFRQCIYRHRAAMLLALSHYMVWYVSVENGLCCWDGMV